MSRERSLTHSVPKFSHKWHGGGPPVHLVLRFLQASHAAEILPLACFFLLLGAGLENWVSLAGLMGLALGGDGILLLVLLLLFASMILAAC